LYKTGRNFWERTKYQYLESTEQKKGREKPPLELEYPKDSLIIDLPKPEDLKIASFDLREAIEKRTSIRKYSEEQLSLEELSYALWCTQGIKEVVPGVTTFRTVPSAGACHAFETYVLVNKVEEIEPGLYRFLAIKHALLGIKFGDDLADKLTEACLGQKFVKTGALTFFWVAVSERMTWRYGERGYRYLLLDAGHICQNLYLSALSLGCGTCALAAFQDDDLNSVLGLDGQDEFVVYGVSLGKRRLPAGNA
jgi:SagB-type dehydrogenase family enzyme